MRPGAWRAYAAGALTGTVVTAAATMLAAPARADITDNDILTHAVPVCMTLDDYPSFAGITGIGEAIADEGYSLEQAGEIIAESIINVCPHHTALMRRFIARYNTADMKA